ncbi:MAG: hypothetical protein COV74_09520 [Candidatus Omnitrophica bacterium CG11_big_fil_rev_8_21_14_0_20_45_26]|uniref:Uncharacterized protein n=1 Tax=Candidatus Abzuiibacterium crystallinum TaxID=1974748 RepID=A0A2H0LLC3_9BACT|nr:MAG: hypothetical protein COV74_09520 [Candidatus Omnitrophica bacterium CG11_big_fil_rev_8_21_14_0_20_45_26]PIW65383.1 MAG: hypothetical protein COW12_02090 [Candidatus Omnitrophica bacterium CG12_big_fil_rev_8_21_14_0_65_45_16]
MKKIYLLLIGIILLTGCFETDFNFKTVVKPSGAVVRETRIDGRGAHLFKAPQDGHWQVKTNVTKGGQSILADTYYHVYAVGRFDKGEQIGSDYQYDAEKQFQDISDEERRNFIQLGIVEPFEQNIYSKNFIQVVRHRGLFTSEYEYQEVFQNKNVIELLLNDIKKEVIREQSVSLPVRPSILNDITIFAEKNEETKESAEESGKEKNEDKAEAEKTKTEKVEEEVAEAPTGDMPVEAQKSPVTLEGQLLSSSAVESIARERMESEVLSKFRFYSEVTLPGKIISTNGDSIVGNTVVWKFSMSDFKPEHSRFVLKAASSMIEWTTIILLVVLLLVILFGISYFRVNPSKSGTSKRRRS